MRDHGTATWGAFPAYVVEEPFDHQDAREILEQHGESCGITEITMTGMSGLVQVTLAMTLTLGIEESLGQTNFFAQVAEKAEWLLVAIPRFRRLDVITIHRMLSLEE